jgi:hypothetical protein
MLPAILVLALLVPTAAGAQALRPDHRIVDQPDAPVQVTAYRTELLKRTAEAPAGLRHDLEFRNRGEQPVVAVQFALAAFDVWNEFLERHAALATDGMNPADRKRSSWFTATDSGIAFLTGVVYVERVRFANGEIWTANLETVLAAMRAIQKDFTADQLTQKRTR